MVRDNFRLVELANAELQATSDTVASTSIYRCDSVFEPESVILDGRTSDELRITVRDDLSGLLALSASIEAYKLFTDFE